MKGVENEQERTRHVLDSLPQRISEAVESAHTRAEERCSERARLAQERDDAMVAMLDRHLQAHGKDPVDVGRPEGHWPERLDPEIANELVQVKRRPKSVATLLVGLLVSVVGLVSPAAASKIKAGFLWLLK